MPLWGEVVSGAPARMRRMASELSDDQTRCLTDETCAFGVAWYEGRVENGEFVGDLVGNDADVEKGRAWLRGEDVTPRLRAPFVR